MNSNNKVFIAKSLDGYIADKNGGIDWLNNYPNPDQNDMGYNVFMQGIDAILMGRNTYKTVLSFGIEWPYKTPVYVWSNKLKSIPQELKSKVFQVKGEPKSILTHIHQKGHQQLYIDGGRTIRSFLAEDLIDEMILTTIPLILGDGIPLFGGLDTKLEFELVESKVFLNNIVQNQYKRKEILSS